MIMKKDEFKIEIIKSGIPQKETEIRLFKALSLLLSKEDLCQGEYKN